MTESKLTRAYRHIAGRIEDGRFTPGHRLVLAPLAAELDMSVVPVREAIRLLEAEGLVTFERNIGAQVAMINAEEYIAVYDALTVVESAAIALAAPNMQPAAIERARAVNDQMRRSIHDFFDPTSFSALNMEFHRALYDACPNEQLLDMVRRSWSRLANLRDSMFSFVPERAPHSVEEHARIVDLIAAGAPSAEIEQAVRDHRDSTMCALQDYRAAHQHHDLAAIAAE